MQHHPNAMRMAVGKKLALLMIGLLLLSTANVDAEQDYRFLPTPVGGGQDVSYYINAVSGAEYCHKS